jgi:hypothetical protein
MTVRLFDQTENQISVISVPGENFLKLKVETMSNTQPPPSDFCYLPDSCV